MSDERDELITIQALVDLMRDSDMLHMDLTEVSNRLQTLIDNHEEMLELDTQYVQDVCEYLCEAPMEFTSRLDPPESRNAGIEQLISQLEAIITKNDEIEQMDESNMPTNKQIEEWNDQFPPGTQVDVTDDVGKVTEQVTRSIAWDVCGNAVVMISGRTGGYLLERCVPVGD